MKIGRVMLVLEDCEEFLCQCALEIEFLFFIN